jgi:CRP/FNR family cyclic AMP-dependent transcriptional regulator
MNAGIRQLLAAHPFFHGLDEDTLRLLAGCATNEHLAADQLLFRAGEPADRFYVVRRGLVALDLSGPGTAHMVLDTAEAGGVVGWSWLVAPYRWFCDARAVEPTDVVAFDASCLRDKCAADPALGYELMQRVVRVMLHRLQASRVRLLDLYGVPRAQRW